MIGSIRKHAQKGGFKLILWLATLSVVGSGFFAMFFRQKESKENVIASFGKYNITIDDFRRAYLPIANFIEDVKKKYGAQAQSILSLFSAGESPELTVIDELINKKVLQSIFDSTQSHIGKDYIIEKLREPKFISEVFAGIIPPQIFEGGQFDSKMLENILNHLGLSESAFEEMVRNLIMQQLALQLIYGAVYIPYTEIKQEFIRAYSKKRFALATFDIENYLKKAKSQKLDEVEIKKYYEQNKAKYATSEKRTAQVWEFSPENYNVEATDKQISNYYNQHKEQYIDSPAELEIKRIQFKVKEIDGKPVDELEQKKRAEAVEAQIKRSPSEFDKLASQYSQDSTYKLKRGDKDPVLENAAFGLAKKGDISGVVKTFSGFEIIKLVDKKDVKYKPLDSVKEQIKKEVINSRFRDSFETDAKRILNQESDVPGIFTRFITEKKAKESKLDNVTSDNNDIKAKKLFELEALKDKGLVIENNKGYIIIFTNLIKSTIPTISEVKDKIIKDIYYQQAVDAMKADMKKVYDLLDKEKLANSVKEIVGAKYETSDLIDPQNNKEIKKIEESNKPYSKALNLTVLNSAIQEITDKAGFIIQLIELEPIDEKKIQENKRALSLRLFKNQAEIISISLIKELLNKTKPEINVNLIKQIARKV